MNLYQISFKGSEGNLVPLHFLWHSKIVLVNTKTEHLVLQTGESNLKNVILSQNGILRSTAIGLAVTNYEANSFYFPRDEHRCELNFTAEERKDKIMVNR